jgi:hypothetical protein
MQKCWRENSFSLGEDNVFVIINTIKEYENYGSLICT